MANTVFELQGKIGLDTSSFYQSLQNVMRATEQFRRSISSISTTVNGVQSSFSSLSGSVGTSDSSLQDLNKSMELAQRETYSARQSVLNLSAAYEQSKAATGANSEQTKALEKELEKAREKLRDCEKAEEDISKDIETYTSNANAATNSTDKMNDSVKKSGETAKSSGNQFASFGDILKANVIGDVIIKGIETVTGKIKQLGDTAVNAVTNFTKNAVGVGMGFDSAMSQVAATMGLTMQEMQEKVGEVDLAWGHFSGNLRDYAKEMGKNTAFSATEAAQALNYMALAGYDAQKSMDMLPKVLNLAASGGMDLARASDMITDTQTALGLSLERTGKLVDQMAKTASRSNTSVSQLGDAMLTIGANAKSLNGGLIRLEDGTTRTYDGVTELSSALGILADNGVKAGEAGTALRNILSSLSGDKFQTNITEKFGISAYDEVTGKMRSLKDIFSDLNKVTGKMTQKERDDLISDVFNKYDTAKVKALLDTSVERWDTLTSEIMDAQGAAQAMANTQLDNLTGNITIFKSALEGAQIALSDKLSPALSDFVKLGTKQVSGLTEAFENGGFLGALDNVVGYVEQWKNLISEKISSIIDGSELSKIFGRVGGIIIDSIYKSAQKIPQRIGLITQLIKKSMDLITRNLPNFTNIAVKIIDKFTESLVDVANSDSLEKFVSAIVNSIEKIVPSLTRAISAVISVIAAKLGDFTEIIIPAVIDIAVASVNAIAENINPIVKSISTVLPKIVNAIVENIAPLIDATTQIITSLVDAVTQDNGVLDGVVDLINGVIDAIVENIDPILLATEKLLNTVIGKLLEPETIEKIVNSVAKVLSIAFVGAAKVLGSTAGLTVQLAATLGETLEKATEDAVHNLPDIFAGIGKSIIEGFGVDTTYWDEYFEEVGGKVFDFVDGTKTKIGTAIVNGFSDFTESVNKVLEFFEGFGGYIYDSLQKVGEDWDKFWTGVAEGFTKYINGIVDGINDIPNKIGELVNNAKQWGSNLMSNFLSGITEKLGDSKIAGIASKLLGFDDTSKTIPTPKTSPTSPVTDNTKTTGTGGAGGVTINFTQNNTSPESLDEYEIWRQSQRATDLMRLQLQGG